MQVKQNTGILFPADGFQKREVIHVLIFIVMMNHQRISVLKCRAGYSHGQTRNIRGSPCRKKHADCRKFPAPEQRSLKIAGISHFLGSFPDDDTGFL